MKMTLGQLFGGGWRDLEVEAVAAGTFMFVFMGFFAALFARFFWRNID